MSASNGARSTTTPHVVPAPVATTDERLLQVLERLAAVLENLPNAVALLAEREAHGASEKPKTVMTLDEVLAVAGVGDRALRRWCHLGTFPKPIESGGRRRLWRRRDVERWVEERGAS